MRARTRNAMLRLDGRTGRLERAVTLVEDGMVPGCYTTRGERDLPHPQARPIKVPLDRAQIIKPRVVPEVSILEFSLGYEASSNLWERHGIPALSLVSRGGTYEIVATSGYGENGYSVNGYGGYISPTEYTY